MQGEEQTGQQSYVSTPEHRSRYQPDQTGIESVQQEVDDVIPEDVVSIRGTPGGKSEVEGVGDQQQRPVHPLVGVSREGSRILEKSRDICQIAEVEVVENGMFIVIVETVLQRIGVDKGANTQDHYPTVFHLFSPGASAVIGVPGSIHTHSMMLRPKALLIFRPNRRFNLRKERSFVQK